jgi:hypothetical protein
MIEEVGGTIEWARNKLDSFPKAKRDLGPLFDALGRKCSASFRSFSTETVLLEPLTQIVAGVGMLLAGVLNLVGNLLSGLGLDSLLKGILGATVSLFAHICRWASAKRAKTQGLDKIFIGLGFGHLFPNAKKK